MVKDGREAFGRALTDARAARGLTQKELGKLVGVTASAVSGYERGVFAPDSSIVFDLEQSLGLRAGHLSRHLGFAPPGTKTVTSGVEEAILNDPYLSAADKRQMVRWYRAVAGLSAG